MVILCSLQKSFKSNFIITKGIGMLFLLRFVSLFFCILFFSFSNPSNALPIKAQKKIDELISHSLREKNGFYQRFEISYSDILEIDGMPNQIHTPYRFEIANTILQSVFASLDNESKAVLMHSENLSSVKHVYLYKQNYHGIEVETSQAKVIFDDTQKIVSVHHNFRNLHGLQPGKLSSAQAINTVIHSAGIPLSLEYTKIMPKLARQKIIMLGNQPVIVWEIPYPVSFLLSNYYYMVDTVSGKIMRTDNRIFYENKAQVFLPSPQSRVDLSGTSTVTLPHLIADQNYLSGDVITAYNCLEFGPNGKTSTITVKIPPEYQDAVPFLGDTLEVPICYETQYANKQDDPKNKNFFYTPVEIDDTHTTAHEQWGDPFSEVHAYYHINFMYDYIRNLLDNSEWTLRQVPLKVTANFLMPTFSFGGNGLFQLGPMDNAAFVPKENAALFSQLGIERNYDNIIIGQGSFSDFAYDATILYHEFTHGVIEKYVTLHNPQLFSDGIYFDSGALNEGFADYFSAAASGVVDIAGYVSSQFLKGSGKDMHIMRSVANENICPNHIGGEVHYDGQIWAGTLWQIRTALAENGVLESDFDTMVLHTITDDLLNESIFEDAAHAIIENVYQNFGETQSMTAKKIFEERGVIHCKRIKDIDHTDQGMTFIPSKSMFQNFAFAPPPAQYRVLSKTGSDKVLLNFTLDKNAGLSASVMTNPGSLFGGSQEIKVLLLGKKSSAVTFTYNMQGISADHDFEVPITFTSQDDSFVAEIPIEPDCEQEYYFAMANAGDQSFVIAQVEADHEISKDFKTSVCDLTTGDNDDSDAVKTSTKSDQADSDNFDDHDNILTSTVGDTVVDDNLKTDKSKGCGCSQENNSHDNKTVLLLTVIIIGMILLRRKAV